MPKSKSHRKQPARRRGRERHISIRSELRKEPDLQKIARAVVAIAMAQAEKEAQAEAVARQQQADQEHTDG
jgi:hypothetical protein